MSPKDAAKLAAMPRRGPGWYEPGAHVGNVYSSGGRAVEPMHTYQGTVVLRSIAGGATLKPGMEVIDGLSGRWLAAWVVGPRDGRYAGEWAMVPDDEFTRAMCAVCNIGWIASGDMTFP